MCTFRDLPENYRNHRLVEIQSWNTVMNQKTYYKKYFELNLLRKIVGRCRELGQKRSPDVQKNFLIRRPEPFCDFYYKYLEHSQKSPQHSQSYPQYCRSHQISVLLFQKDHQNISRNSSKFLQNHSRRSSRSAPVVHKQCPEQFQQFH